MVGNHRIRWSRAVVGVAAVAASVTFWALAAASPVSQQGVPSEEVLERGRTVYTEQCQSCHGSEGHGDGPAARFVQPKPRDLSKGEWQYAEDGTVEAVSALIRDGIDDSPMTPFDEVLTDDEIRAVASFVVHVLVTEQGS